MGQRMNEENQEQDQKDEIAGKQSSVVRPDKVVGDALIKAATNIG